MASREPTLISGDGDPKPYKVYRVDAGGKEIQRVAAYATKQEAYSHKRSLNFHFAIRYGDNKIWPVKWLPMDDEIKGNRTLKQNIMSIDYTGPGIGGRHAKITLNDGSTMHATYDPATYEILHLRGGPSRGTRVRRQLQELFTAHAKEHEGAEVQAVAAHVAEADTEAERVRLKETERWHQSELKRQAAPALYRELQRAVKYFEDDGGDAKHKFLPDMRAALAKARENS